MRGKAFNHRFFIHKYRITPAYAGKSLQMIDSLVQGLRITPAYAGKSSRHGGQSKRTGDHPRLCGEKEHGKICLLLTLGSPPPMRGKAVLVRNDEIADRITPAYAGKSIAANFKRSIAKDHPRLCGEKHACVPHFPVLVGSPPPMRGKATLTTRQ